MSYEDRPQGDDPCMVDDCAICWNRCIEFPHNYAHDDGKPFCTLGRPVKVLALVQGETMDRGCMVPDVPPDALERIKQHVKG